MTSLIYNTSIMEDTDILVRQKASPFKTMTLLPSIYPNSAFYKVPSHFIKFETWTVRTSCRGLLH